MDRLQTQGVIPPSAVPRKYARLKNGAKNILAMAFGVSLAFVIAEIALSFFFPPPPKFRYPQPRHLRDPELGWVMTPNQTSFTIGQVVTVNDMGFRSDEISGEKPDGGLRIICLGDSQTFGNGVAQPDVYPAQLEAILESRLESPVEVINTGVQAYDTLQEVRLLERHAGALNPDIVTLGFYINDIFEARGKNRSEAVGAGGEMKRHGLKRFTPYRLIYLVKRSRVMILVLERLSRSKQSDKYAEILAGRTPTFLEESWAVIEQNLAAARDLAKAQGFRLIVFPIPAAPEFLQNGPDEAYRSRFIALANRLGIEHFDPTPALKASGGSFEENFIAWDGHINATSHRFIAESLAREILRPEHDSLEQ